MTSLVITEEPNGAALWLQDESGLHFLEQHRDFTSAKMSMDTLTREVRKQQEADHVLRSNSRPART